MTTPRLIARRSVHGHRECHAEGDPTTAATGERPLEALARLCAVLGLPDRGYVIAESAADRVVYVRRADRTFDEPCPECGGSGKYVGLNVAEECRGCGGTGRVA